MEHPAFSTGVRTCQGKKFASVEAVAFLACFFRDWKVSVKGDLDGDREKRMFPVMGTTMGLREFPLVLTRRDRGGI